MKERFKMMVRGRIWKPEEIASVAVFLALNESSYITGIDLPVDGRIVDAIPAGTRFESCGRRNATVVAKNPSQTVLD